MYIIYLTFINYNNFLNKIKLIVSDLYNIFCDFEFNYFYNNLELRI